jgi:hypothetical protein
MFSNVRGPVCAVDVEQSRTRNVGGTNKKTVTSPMDTPERRAQVDHDEEPLARSLHTDQRIADKDYFRDLIARTRGDFIDVSQEPVPGDTASAAGREEIYKSKCEDVAVVGNVSSFFMIPSPSGSNGGPAVTLSQAMDFPVDGKLQGSLQQIANAAKLEVQNVGELVVPLPAFTGGKAL